MNGLQNNERKAFWNMQSYNGDWPAAQRNQPSGITELPKHLVLPESRNSLLLQSLDQIKGMDRFRDQFKLEAPPVTIHQYL